MGNLEILVGSRLAALFVVTLTRVWCRESFFEMIRRCILIVFTEIGPVRAEGQGLYEPFLAFLD